MCMSRTDPHRNLMWNWDIACAPEGMRMFPDSGQVEGLAFNLCVAPTDSLGPSVL